MILQMMVIVWMALVRGSRLGVESIRQVLRWAIARSTT